MKVLYTFRIFAFTALLLAGLNVNAQTQSYTTTTTGTWNWNTTANWLKNGSPATTWPGQIAENFTVTINSTSGDVRMNSVFHASSSCKGITVANSATTLTIWTSNTIDGNLSPAGPLVTDANRTITLSGDYLGGGLVTTDANNPINFIFNGSKTNGNYQVFRSRRGTQIGTITINSGTAVRVDSNLLVRGTNGIACNSNVTPQFLAPDRVTISMRSSGGPGFGSRITGAGTGEVQINRLEQYSTGGNPSGYVISRSIKCDSINIGGATTHMICLDTASFTIETNYIANIGGTPSGEGIYSRGSEYVTRFNHNITLKVNNDINLGGAILNLFRPGTGSNAGFNVRGNLELANTVSATHTTSTSAASTVNNLVISGTGTIGLTGFGSLNVRGSIINTVGGPSLTFPRRVTMAGEWGTAAPSSIGVVGGAPITFNSLTISNASNTVNTSTMTGVSLNQDISINGAFTGTNNATNRALGFNNFNVRLATNGYKVIFNTTDPSNTSSLVCATGNTIQSNPHVFRKDMTNAAGGWPIVEVNNTTVALQSASNFHFESINVISGGFNKTAGSDTIDVELQTASTVTVASSQSLRMSNSATIRTLNGGSYSISGTFGIVSGSIKLHYNTGATFTRGNEWPNTAGVVSELMVGPLSGSANNSSLTLGTLGSRDVTTRVYINSSGTAITGALPISSGATIERAAGTFSVAPTFGANTNVTYLGGVTTGVELPTSGLQTLTINPGSGNTVTLNANVAPAIALTLSSGILATSTFTFNGGGSASLTQANGTTLRIGGTSSFPTGYSSVSLNSGSTVEYNSTSAQTVTARNYGNLTINGSRGANNVTLASGTIDVAGDFTVGATFSSGTWVNSGNTFNYSNTGATTIQGINYNNLSSANADRTLSGTIRILGTFTPGTGTYTTASSTVEFNGTGAQSIPALNYNNLTVSSARGANDITLASSGTISVAGAFNNSATFSSGAYVTTGSTVSFIGSGQTIPNLGSRYNNLTVNQTSGNASMGGSFGVNGTLTLTAGKLNLGANTLTLGESATISITSPSGTKMIDKGTGSIIKEYNAPSSVSITFPIGSGSDYTPATISNLSATGTGSITLSMIGSPHPDLAAPSVALARYWSFTVTGLTITSADLSLTYVAGDVNGTEAAYVIRRRSGGSWLDPSGSISSPTITITGINANLNGDFTAGELSAFAAISIYYSLGGDWNTAASWSTVAFGGAPAVSVPSSADQVRIGDNKTITVTTNNIQATSLQIQASGILQFNDITSGHAVGNITGTGKILFNNTTSTTPLIAIGTLTDFVSNTGGTVEFGGTGAYTLPSQGTYNTVTISGTGTKTSGANIVLNSGLTVATGASFTVDDNVEFAGNTFTVNGTYNQTAGNTNLNSAGTLILSGSGSTTINNLIISGTTSFNPSASFTVIGNFTNSSTAASAFTPSAGTLTFGGSALQTIGGSGTGTLTFRGLTVGSGASVTTALSFDIVGNLTNSSNGISGSSFDATAGTITLSGNTSQTLTGSGTGTFNFNNLTISGTTTFAPDANFSVDGNLTNSSSATNTIAATGGAFSPATGSTTLTGSGTGALNFSAITIPASSRLSSAISFAIAGNLTNNSNGVSGSSLNLTGGALSFNGSTTQNITGTGSGALNFNGLTVTSGASVSCGQSINVAGDITNSSNGITNWSFNQTSGTTTINGASAQTLSGSGTGFFGVNNLIIANTPSRLDATTRLVINGDFTINSNGLSGIAYSQTADTTVFGGTTAQSYSGGGTGSVAFNHLKIGNSNNARLNASRDYSLGASIRIVSNGIGSPALALNNNFNTVTLTSSAAQTMTGTGTGGIRFHNFALNNASSFTPQLSLSISGNMAVNTTTSPFWNALNTTTLTFNGTAQQNIHGSAGTARTCTTGHVEIAAGAYVFFAANRPMVLQGNFTNNSNGISGNAFNQSATSSGLTFTGSSTFSFTSPGTGLITIGNLTLSSPVRVNCSTSFLVRAGGALTFGSAGQSGVQFSQTAGTTTVNIGGGANSLGGGGAGSVTFFNLTFGNGAPGSSIIDRSFTVTETFTMGSGATNQALLFGTGGDYTVTTKDLVLNSGSFGVSNGSLVTSRVQTLNISGNISGTGTASNTSFSTFTTNTTGASNQLNVVFTGTTQSISGSAPKNWMNVNLGSSTITNTSQGIIIGSYRTTLATPAFARSGSGTWNQSGTGAITFRTQTANITVPAAAFITTTTDTVRFIDTNVVSTLPYTSLGHLKLAHLGGTSSSYNLAGNTSCRDLLIQGGTLNGGSNTLSVSGSIVLSGTGAFSAGTGTVDYNGSTAQNINALTFNNLTLSGAGTKNLTGNVTVNGNYTGNAPLVLGSTARTLTISGDVSGSSSMDISAAAHTVNLGGASNSLSGGILATSNTATVNYNRSGDQSMISGAYRNLTIDGSGAKTLGGTTTVNVDLIVTAGSLALGSTARLLTVTGNTTGAGTLDASGNSNHHVVLNGATNSITTVTLGDAKFTYGRSGAQDLYAGTYRALVFGGSGTKTLAASTVSDSLIMNAGTLDNSAGLTFGTGMALIDNGGALQVAPTFGTSVNLRYTSAGTIGFEMPNTAGVLQNLTIDPGAGNVVSLGTYSPSVSGTLNISSGILSIGSSTLTMNGSLSGTGVIRGNTSGSLIIGGSSGGAFGNLIFESGNNTINDLTINRSGASSSVGLGSNMNVTGTLTFNGSSDCHLNTGSFTLGLGTTGALAGEDNNSYVRGTLTANRTVNSATNLSFGNTGFTIVECVSCNMGNVNFTRTSGPGAAATGETSNSGINRVWSIIPTTQPASQVTIQLSWLSADDNGITGTTARVWKKQGVNPWAKTIWAFPFADRNIILGTTSFSDWTIGDDDLPLPVNLYTFGARMEMGKPIVAWTTLSESNSEKFVLERSKDGKNFTSIAELTAAGNSNTRKDYAYSDAEMTGNDWEVLFYRLRQYDRNGNYVQYDPIRLFRTGVPGKVSAAPIPFNNELTLGFISGSQGSALIRITDVVGKLVATFNQDYGLGTNSLNIRELTNLKPGVYQATVDADGYSMTIKLVKE